MHIGLIGGIGPAATDFYYRGLIDRHVASGVPLEVTIAHADVREMARNLSEGNPRQQAEIFAGLLERRNDVDRARALRRPFHFADIGAGNERAPGAGEHDRLDRGVLPRACEGLDQPGADRGVERVDGRMIDGDDRDLAVLAPRDVMA